MKPTDPIALRLTEKSVLRKKVQNRLPFDLPVSQLPTQLRNILPYR